MYLADVNSIIKFSSGKQSSHDGSFVFDKRENLFEAVFNTIFSDEFDTINSLEISELSIYIENLKFVNADYKLAVKPKRFDYKPTTELNLKLQLLSGDKDETQFALIESFGKENLYGIFEKLHVIYSGLIATNHLENNLLQFKEIQIRIRKNYSAN